MPKEVDAIEVRMPMQDGPDLPEKVGRAIWEIYDYLYGGQSYETIVSRHGFGYEEVQLFITHLKRRRTLQENKCLKKLMRSSPEA